MPKPTLTTPDRWWGYRHVDGSVHVKRYFDMRDLDEAADSDFVGAVRGPFTARNREEALRRMQGAK